MSENSLHLDQPCPVHICSTSAKETVVPRSSGTEDHDRVGALACAGCLARRDVTLSLAVEGAWLFTFLGRTWVTWNNKPSGRWLPILQRGICRARAARSNSNWSVIILPAATRPLAGLRQAQAENRQPSTIRYFIPHLNSH